MMSISTAFGVSNLFSLPIDMSASEANSDLTKRTRRALSADVIEDPTD